jgi:hypothetical protein
MPPRSHSDDELQAHGSLLLRLLLEYGDKHRIQPEDMTAVVISIAMCMQSALQRVNGNRVVH